MLKDFNPESNQSTELRRFCIESSILIFDTKCNIKSCRKAAELTSTYHCNTDILLKNRFIIELTYQLRKIIAQYFNYFHIINIRVLLFLEHQ